MKLVIVALVIILSVADIYSDDREYACEGFHHSDNSTAGLCDRTCIRKTNCVPFTTYNGKDHRYNQLVTSNVGCSESDCARCTTSDANYTCPCTKFILDAIICLDVCPDGYYADDFKNCIGKLIILVFICINIHI